MSIPVAVQTQIERKAGEVAAKCGFELFGYSLVPTKGKVSLRLLIDRSGGGITIDECAEVNRLLTAYLEETAALGDQYTVEVNSPGLDHPLRECRDFRRVAGREVGVWMNEPVSGKTYWEGQVIHAGEDALEIRVKGETCLHIEYEQIKTGKQKFR
ncbi:MAG: hypothetical protein GF333_06345 [Candidatus Omnitrophica bacterium]|nr:hypothetical protein [Candidatus Omnitrophota bacterium]